MSLRGEFKKFRQFTDQLKNEIGVFKESIQKLEMEREKREEVIGVIEEFRNNLLAVKMDLQRPRLGIDGSRLILDYQAVLRGIKAERQFRNKFWEYNEFIEEIQLRRMSRFFTEDLDYNSGKARKMAAKTLKGEIKEYETYLNWARKKGYLSRKSGYNSFEAENELKRITRFEEEYAREFAEKLKNRGFEYGEKVLRNRPVIYVKNSALRDASRATREAAVKGDVRESGGFFYSKRLGDQKILLEEFENWDTYDSKTSTTPRDEHFDVMWGESGRNRIFWHCHPRASDVDRGARYADRLSEGDVEGLTETLNDGSGFGIPGKKAGLREGITILSTPWDQKPVPKEDIVWLACAVSSKGGDSGFLNLHVVDVKSDNPEVIDKNYSWPKIYNEWIKAAMAGAENKGPYSTYLDLKSLEKELGY